MPTCLSVSLPLLAPPRGNTTGAGPPPWTDVLPRERKPARNHKERSRDSVGITALLHQPFFYCSSGMLTTKEELAKEGHFFGSGRESGRVMSLPATLVGRMPGRQGSTTAGTLACKHLVLSPPSNPSSTRYEKVCPRPGPCFRKRCLSAPAYPAYWADQSVLGFTFWHGLSAAWHAHPSSAEGSGWIVPLKWRADENKPLPFRSILEGFGR